MIPIKHLSGLQHTRVGNTLARIQAGCAATLGSGARSGAAGEANALIPVPKALEIDFNKSIIDQSTGIMDERRTIGGRSAGTLRGGILNGINQSTGKVDDGIYYSFLASLDEDVNANNGVLDPEDSFFYVSKFFISYGHGSVAANGGRGEFSRPINPRTGRPVVHIRPMRSVFRILNGRLVPWLMVGESNTVTAYYQFAEWRDYKALTIGGVKFDSNNRRYFDFDAAKPPLRDWEELLGPNDSTWFGAWGVIPQTHKMMQVRIGFEGTGKIYSSVSGNKGELVAIGNGGEGTASFLTMTGSDLAGRGIKLTTEGNIRIMQAYMLWSVSQQPM